MYISTKNKANERIQSFKNFDTNCKFKQRRKTCSCQGIEFKRTKETEKTNKMEELPKIEAIRSGNESNKNNVDKKLMECNIMWIKEEGKRLKTSYWWINYGM